MSSLYLSPGDFRRLGPEGEAAQQAGRPSRTFWQDSWVKLRRHPIGMTGLVAVTIITLTAVFGPIIHGGSYSAQNLLKTFAEPSREHLMGTDNLGRDVFVRLLYGARISLTVGFASTLISLVVGVMYGAISGFYGGKVDNLMMRALEVVSAIPELLYLILLTQVFKPGLTTILIVIGGTGWFSMARVVRGEVLALKEREYVLAARTMGTRPLTIMLRHLIPNAMGPILVTLTVGIPTAIFFESFLSFIGLGISAPMASWGVMASEALTAIRSYPHLLFYPAVAIGATLLAFQFLGQGMRDALDPRIRQ